MNDSVNLQDEAAQGCNVQVAVRCRPMSEEEERKGMVPVVTCDSEKRQIKVQYGAGIKKTQKLYTFDKVLGRFATQEDVFKSCVSTICDEVLEGFSCTVFAYGQTGTGKTWTMEGSLNEEKHYGIIPRSVAAVFKQLESSAADFNCRISFMELYNEELQDLLEPGYNASSSSSKPGAGGKKLRLCEDVKKGVQVLGLEEVACTTLDEVLGVMKRGVQQRQTAATLCNKSSSRSHSIFALKIMIKETTATGEDIVRNGQLNLVDLAGSECVGRSGAKNERAREAGNINQSLLTLGRVITALVEPGHAHIPYRDSKLTRLLQESLGGKAKTCIIATLSPSPSNIDETLSTLDYAFRAKSIKNKPEVNQKMTSRTLLKEYSYEIESLKLMLQATQQKNGIFLPPSQYEQMQATIASQTDRLKEAEQEVKLRSQELEVAQAAVDETKAKLEEAEEKLTVTETALTESREEASRLASDLQKTEWDLEATRAVVEEQIKTEEELKRQGATLQASLASARADVDGLRAKIGRHCEELQSRVSAAGAFQTTCHTSLTTLQSLLDDLHATTQSSAHLIADAVGELAKEEVQQSEALIEKLRAEITMMADEGGATANRVGKEMCAKLSKQMEELVVRMVQRQSRAILNKVQAYQRESESKVSEVSSAFARTSASMGATLDALAKHADDAKTELASLTADLSISAAGLVSDLQAYSREAQRGREEAEGRLASYMEEAKRRMEQASQAIIQSVSEQMSAMVEECATGNSTFLQGARQDGVAAQAILDKYSQGFAQKVEAIESATHARVENGVSGKCLLPLTKEAGGAKAMLMEVQAPAHGASLQGMREQAMDLVAAMRVTSLGTGEQFHAALKSGAEVVRNIEKETEAVGTFLQDKKVEADATAQTAKQEAAARLDAGASRITDMIGSSMRDPVSTGVKSSVQQVSTSSTLVADYTTTAQQVAPPTNLTPQKRAYPEPSQLSSTRPHDAIMAEALEELRQHGKRSRAATVATITMTNDTKPADAQEEAASTASEVMMAVDSAASSQREEDNNNNNEAATNSSVPQGEQPNKGDGDEENKSSKSKMEVVMEEGEEASTTSCSKDVTTSSMEGGNGGVVATRSSKRRVAASRIPRGPSTRGALVPVNQSDLNRE